MVKIIKHKIIIKFIFKYNLKLKKIITAHVAVKHLGSDQRHTRKGRLEHCGLVFASCSEVFFNYLASDQELSVYWRSYEGLGLSTGVFAVCGEE